MMKKTFTLIELLVVVAIIGILVTLLLPSLNKARKKAMVAVCLSNQKQIAGAAQMFVKQNNGRFPYAKFPGGDTNTGRFWLGKLGKSGDYKVNVTRRPLNKYLGYSRDNMETPIANCPMNTKGSEYKSSGSDYMGACRQEYNDDLDTATNSIFLSEVLKPSTMNLVGEIGGWHFISWENNPWRQGTQWHEKGKPVYSFSYIDGHAANLKVRGGLGITSDSGIINFRNF